MSRAFNTINSSDRSTTPIKLRYTASYNSANFSSYGISELIGINGQINVYPSEYISCIFEDDSFYEYFLSPDSRNRRIDEILS